MKVSLKIYFVCHCSERTYVIYGNIMYDRRVIRGNTYAQTVIPTVCHLLHTGFMFASTFHCVYVMPRNLPLRTVSAFVYINSVFFVIVHCDTLLVIPRKPLK